MACEMASEDFDWLVSFPLPMGMGFMKLSPLDRVGNKKPAQKNPPNKTKKNA
jgi:hypothetical protein